MGKAIIIYSVRPDGPDVDLNGILEKVKTLDHFTVSEEKDFMFGMKQLFVTFTFPEGVGPAETEEALKKIDGVQSVNEEAATLA